MTSLPASIMTRLTAASAALTDRQRARYTSERVNDAEDEETARGTSSNATGAATGESLSPSSRRRSGSTESLVAAAAASEEETLANSSSNNNNNNSSSTSSNSSTRNNNIASNANVTATARGGDGDDDDDDGSEGEPRSADPEAGEGQSEGNNNNNNSGDEPWTYRTTMTLAELEEERELARRRMSACVLLTVFVLFKLWIDCIEQPSLPLLMVCLIGTSWTARWIRYNREREEELDRRIAQYLQANQTDAESGETGGGVMDRNDLRMLSFQAQLALAIMESQRHMMEGGRPDGDHQNPGVSEAAKAQWGVVKFHNTAQYGSVKEVDAPHCSICLGEYEEGENLAQLPCQHLYHRDCIDSWTENHTKCPLCMADLEIAEEGGSNNV